jgi:NhaP-type Na+/H+ or K+/H+ antiporter
MTVRRQAFAPVAAGAVGVTLIGWVAVEMVVLAGLGSLAWALYLLLGACIAMVGVGWWRASLHAVR